MNWKSAPELVEVADPIAGPGQVVIKVGAAGLCHSDLHFIHDFKAGDLPFDVPYTLGHENAGWVDQIGEGVHGLDVGQPVAVYGFWGCGHCYRCRQGMENFCDNTASLTGFGGGVGLDGGLADYMLVPSARLLIPLDRLSPTAAAPLTDAGLTPYRAVKRSLPILTPGSSAVIIGAGGLGHLGIQMLKQLSPARVIAVDRNPEALSLAADLGADVCIVSDESAAAALHDATNGHGAEAVMDFVGTNDTLALAAAAVRALGHITLVGVAGGTIPFGFFATPYEVSFANSNWGTIPELIEVLTLAEQSRIQVHIEKVTLKDVAKTYDRMANGDLIGRAVAIP